MWGRGEGWGREGSLLQKAPLPHAPSSLPPKTFDLIESLLPVFQDYLLI